ncbi:purine nucleoside permease, partial [Actinomadura adrarensis]
RAYFITAGIAGTSPDTGTLGFAAWARWLVDFDLGHHVLPEEAPEIPHGYLPMDDAGTNVYRLNEKLVRKAYELTKDLKLTDSEDAIANRAKYPQQVGKKPFVAMCDTVTGDNFWGGKKMSQRAEYIMGLKTQNQGRYCTTQMEDNATATVLARHGYLQRYLSVRTASDFDQPYPGQTVEDVLTNFPGFVPAVANAYAAASTVADHLLKQNT